ncbi:uncharacterized protein LOC107359524 [Tetranychus urticae]|nr:uncharacterized protein LOC107359524 [Tetranychus urticae]
METLKVPATDDWTFKSEATYCNDGRTTRDIERYQNYVILIRVFYLAGPLFDHEVVLADFVPFDLSSETFARRNGEKFSSMISRAALWLRENTELSLVNAQAVDIHVPDPDAETIETRITWKRKERNDKEIRFLRIYCTKRNEVSKLFLNYESLSVSSLEYKLYLTAIAFNVKSFQQDVNEWFVDLAQRNNGIKPRIVNIETCVVPPFVNDQTGKSFQHAVDETHSCNQMDGRFKYSFVTIRIYYDESGLETGDFQITRLP